MDNLHITLVFLGDVEDNKISEISRVIRGIAQNFQPFNISFDNIRIGPNFNAPRMIWLSGFSNKFLSKLVWQIIEGLVKIKIRLKNNRSFTLHVTLARAISSGLRGIEIEEIFERSFKASEIHVVESRLMPGGPEYTVLDRIKFNFWQSFK